MIRIGKREYRGWKNAYSLSNGVVDVVILADVGPRIIHYGLHSRENQFHEFADQGGSIGGAQFRLYGGHRLWVWPEIESTYYPDNRSVEVAEVERGLRFSSPIESEFPGICLQKQMRVQISESCSRVIVTHTLTNHGSSSDRIAPWAPTVLKPGGRSILPFPPRAAMDKEHYQSVGPLTLWSFTDFSDPRWHLGREFLQLKQQENPSGRFREQMSGLFNIAEWGAYYRSGDLFLKRATLIPGATYPDYGCNFEVFTNPEFLELETLGPVVALAPGESTEHTEHWWLFESVPPGEGDSWVHSAVMPLVERTKSK